MFALCCPRPLKTTLYSCTVQAIQAIKSLRRQTSNVAMAMVCPDTRVFARKISTTIPSLVNVNLRS